MTVWHVTELYSGNKKTFQVLPYNLKGTIRVYLKIEHGIWRLLQFLYNSRLSKKKAEELKAEKEFEELFEERYKTK